MTASAPHHRVDVFLDAVSTLFADFARRDLMPVGTESRVAEAARYSVEGGGKRLRPALVIASAFALAPDSEGRPELARLDGLVTARLVARSGDIAGADLLAVAAAFEYIHTYSLIHDDLPVMDNDAIRRGRPACHVAFGVETAIRAGVRLILRAFALLEGTSLPGKREIIATLAEVSGIRGMVGGQALDILGENRPPDAASLIRIHTKKTAALIRGAMAAGALAVGADELTLRRFAEAGDAMGLAFQVADDLLDVESTTEKMGKPVGVDGGKGKRTYPAVLGVEASKARAAELISAAGDALKQADCQDTLLLELARFMVNREH